MALVFVTGYTIIFPHLYPQVWVQKVGTYPKPNSQHNAQEQKACYPKSARKKKATALIPEEAQAAIDIEFHGPPSAHAPTQPLLESVNAWILLYDSWESDC